ncbi:hypothetical protein SAMN05444722_1375 [Rhodovulum sp. ES.010]|uniref:DUF4760 domain-containing protein n=1 Tax=Rhodovulum sp. ES.010 TaxID=1882821 RepID=UPI000929F91E|nr:hypothetical protein [Rhodovulum sp. ES.010]SIO31315.1 hypothetical protein SAMN05444722_1375 [Rhodovulum sp. ES.010]
MTDLLPLLSSNLLAAVMGAVIGALAVNWLSRRYARVRQVFDLHREFSTPDMLDHRGKCETGLVALKRDGTLPGFLRLEAAGQDSVWAVLAFYERLALAARHGQVHTRLMAGLFGEVYIYYWDQYFGAFENTENLDLPRDLERLAVKIKKADRRSHKRWVENGRARYARLERRLQKEAPAS